MKQEFSDADPSILAAIVGRQLGGEGVAPQTSRVAAPTAPMASEEAPPGTDSY